MHRRLPGLGAFVADVTGVALLFPGGGLEPAPSAIGFGIGARWGQRLAVGVLAVNLVGDSVNALMRGDFRTLIGLPIAGAMILYLLRPPYELGSASIARKWESSL